MSYHPRFYEARRLLNALGISPAYFVAADQSGPCRLSEGERQFAFESQSENTIAFTSPVADLMFSSYLKYEWRGRGCCIAFRRYPGLLSQAAVLGIVLHEAGHWVADCDRPERNDTDMARAVKTAWQSMAPAAEHHNHRWLRATIHLWWRANAAGWSIPLAETIVLEQYGFDAGTLGPLLAEARLRECEPIESILRSDNTVQERPRQIRPASSATPTARIQRRPKYPRIEIIGGHAVKRYIDGSIETLPNLQGRGGGVRFKSVLEMLGGHRRARTT